MWKHFSKIIDSLDINNNFPMGFDFSTYYEAFNETETEVVVKLCKQKYNEFVKNYGKFKWFMCLLIKSVYRIKFNLCC